MRSIILTGSGPSLPNWWDKNRHKLEGFEVHSINTSLLVTLDRCDRWFRSSDFYSFHKDQEDTLRYHEDRINRVNAIKYPPPVNPHPTHTVAWPFRYWTNETSGTMLFNILLELLNEAFWGENIQDVNLVGCDMVYKNDGKDHFYGKGTADPTRLGEDCLLTNLNMFKKAFRKMGVDVYNLSEEEKTLLPFPRRALYL